jgi:hypothetical protein
MMKKIYILDKGKYLFKLGWQMVKIGCEEFVGCVSLIWPGCGGEEMLGLRRARYLL